MRRVMALLWHMMISGEAFQQSLGSRFQMTAPKWGAQNVQLQVATETYMQIALYVSRVDSSVVRRGGLARLHPSIQHEIQTVRVKVYT